MKALIVYGGWSGHEPDKIAAILADALRRNGLEAELSDSLDSYLDADRLAGLDLVVQHWTMGQLTKAQWAGLDRAVRGGTGIAGLHGGLGDSFRASPDYQFMVGGQWVAHPGGISDYRVHIVDHADPVTAGLSHFDMHSEQYYMHVDPSNHVLATTTFECNGCTMPAVWKRTWGKGRVFYSSLGHVAADFDAPEVLTIMERGMCWAARAGRVDRPEKESS